MVLWRQPITLGSLLFFTLTTLDDSRNVPHVLVEFSGRPVDIHHTHLHHNEEGSAIRDTQTANLLSESHTTLNHQIDHSERRIDHLFLQKNPTPIQLIP